MSTRTLNEEIPDVGGVAMRCEKLRNPQRLGLLFMYSQRPWRGWIFLCIACTNVPKSIPKQVIGAKEYKCKKGHTMKSH